MKKKCKEEAKYITAKTNQFKKKIANESKGGFAISNTNHLIFSNLGNYVVLLF